MDLDAPTRLAVCYAGLVHDIGVIAAGAGLSDHVVGDERLVFASMPLLDPEEAAAGISKSSDVVTDRLTEHPIHGARYASELALPQETIRGVAAHHEKWNGSGYPHGLRGQDIPIVGRVVALADQVESLISQASPLQARRDLQVLLSTLSGTVADPEIVQAMRSLSAGDQFWLGLLSSDLSSELEALCARQREPKGTRLLSFAETFAEIVDSRFAFMMGVSAKVAKYAEAIGRNAGLSEQRVRQLRLAALLHDIGQLAVSERIIAKPGILSVNEHDLLTVHPLYSRDIIEGINGLAEVAEWVVAHHERLDGKGYPEGRSGDEIPFEARILAVADAYVSITSDRPHRARSESSEAVRRLRAASGTQLDGDVVDILVTSVLP
jgi:HD-GYP domain-containing protein (c-di-GMP phosphodiesterase class II)